MIMTVTYREMFALWLPIRKFPESDSKFGLVRRRKGITVFVRRLKQSKELRVLSRVEVQRLEVIGHGFLQFAEARRHYAASSMQVAKRKDYGVLNDGDVKFFEHIVGSRAITNPSELDGYNTDWIKTVKGASKLVIRPKTTKEVSVILAYCEHRNLAVCPQGGNTGLVGGSVPIYDEIVLSMSLMNQIVHIDPVAGVVVCQAGCVLERLDQELEKHGLMMPLDLGAKGSCQIGGNLSTNAGGLRLLRYGSLRANTLGLEVVLPSGKVLDCMSTLRKDNTGYDLKQLFIGAEGTLGVITAAAILCPRRSPAVNLSLLGVKDFESVLSVFRQTRASLNEILSALEFMDRASMQCSEKNLHLKNPVQDCPFYCLIETSGSVQEHDEAKLTQLLGRLMESKLVVDGTVAAEPTKIKSIWQLRERLAEAQLREGYPFKYDISLPLGTMYDIVEMMRSRLLGTAVTSIMGYGHLGDGNLHLNIIAPKFDANILAIVEPYIYDWTAQQKGSVSAEHGLGSKKRQYIYHSKTVDVDQIVLNTRIHLVGWTSLVLIGWTSCVLIGWKELCPDWMKGAAS